MSKIVLGKYVNTHGIKGEIRIESNFKYKERVFNIGNEIIINNIVYQINSYRVHKGYDMITLKDIDDINEIPFAKNTLVYIEKEKYLTKNDYLDSDLIGFIVYNKDIQVEVSNIRYINDEKKLLDCHGRLIPFELILDIDLKNKKIKLMEVDGL